MKKTLLLTLFLTLILLSALSLAQTTTFNSLSGTCTLYDDFSTGTLNLNKWQEINANLDEHFVSSNEGRYHTAQLTQADKSVTLQALRTFLPGDTVEYDLFYENGTDNRLSIVDIDGQTTWFGLVGLWNGQVMQGGNEFGKYHFKVVFTLNGADIFIINPQGVTIQIQAFPQTPGSSHTFGFHTRTGHNGIVHMDYDNVKTCKQPQPNQPTLVNPPLVSYWSFNEGSGTTVFDGTSNHNDGTLQGATWTNDSFSGYALEFDGVDDRIFVGQPSSLNLHDKVKIEAWIKRDSAADGMVVSKNGPYYLAIRGDSVEGGVYVTTGGNHWEFVQGTTDLQLNQWYRVAMEYDGVKLRVFVQGVEDALIPVSGTMPFTGQNFYMGWGEPGQDQYFDGVMDEVKIWGV